MRRRHHLEEDPSLSYVDRHGTCLADHLFCVGICHNFTYGILDAEYNYGLSTEDALELGGTSLLAATYRDAFPGGFINLYHNKEQG